MPTQQIYVPPEVIIEHRGVAIYRCYEDDDIAQPEAFIFSTDARNTDSSCVHPSIFDIRNFRAELRKLPEEPHNPKTHAEITRTLIELIEAETLR